MNPELYSAISHGTLRRYPNYANSATTNQLTHDKNNILHVACEYRQLHVVKDIISTYDADKVFNLLCGKNWRDETPFHIASRNNMCNTVKEMLKHLINTNGVEAMKGVLRVLNKVGETALHLASRFGDADIISELVKADFEHKYLPDNAGRTPTYNVIFYSRNSLGLKALLDLSSYLDYTAPSATTVMHVASVLSSSEASLSLLLRYASDLKNETDGVGWYPIHYAACAGNEYSVQRLLTNDDSLAYIPTMDDVGYIALHICAIKENVELMDIILSHSPGCWAITNRKGQNVLHIASLCEVSSSIAFILQQPWSKYLISMEDNEGTSAYHALVDRGFKSMLSEMGHLSTTYNHMQMRKNKQTLQRSKDYRFPYIYGIKLVRNELEEKQLLGRTIPEIEMEESEIANKKVEQIKNMANTQMIVIGFVATIAFTAGVNIPGGYNSNGTGILGKKASFQAFMITGLISLALSMIAVYLHFTAANYSKVDDLIGRYMFAAWCVLIGLLSMVVTFIVSAFMVLENSPATFDFIIAICIVFFLFWIIELKKMGFFQLVWDKVFRRGIYTE